MEAYKSLIIKALNNQIGEFDESQIVLNKIDTNGDYSFPCFALSKMLKKSPIAIAEELAQKLFIKDVRVEAKSGYLNFFIDKTKLAKTVFSAVQKGDETLFSENVGKGQIVAIDFSSVNLAKHFHIGHMRNTILGAALSNIFEAYGYKTQKLNYLGDFGIAYGELIATAEYLNKDIYKCDVNELQKIYAESKELCADGSELKKKAQEYFVKITKGDKELCDKFEQIKKNTLSETQSIFDEFNISFDSFRGEAYYEQFTSKYLKELEEKGVSEVGDDGAIIVNLKPYGLTVAVLVSSAGYTLYPLRDIAAAVEREKEHKFDKLLYITGTEQIPHFKNVFKTIELLGYTDTAKKLEHIYYGRYSLEDGKLSSRYGAKALLKDILAEAKTRAKKAILEKNKVEDDIDELASKIGIGALVYNALSITRAKDIVFNLDRTLQFDGETGPYLQYVLARINSLFAKAGVSESECKLNEKLLTEDELKIYKLVYMFKYNNIIALNEREPSYVAKYLIDIAKTFNQFYNVSKVVTEDKELTSSRLATCKVVKSALKFGFKLLGIPVVEKM